MSWSWVECFVKLICDHLNTRSTKGFQVKRQKDLQNVARVLHCDIPLRNPPFSRQRGVILTRSLESTHLQIVDSCFFLAMKGDDTRKVVEHYPIRCTGLASVTMTLRKLPRSLPSIKQSKQRIFTA